MSAANSEELALAKGLKPAPNVAEPVGNRTASGTMARDSRANSTSAGDFMSDTDEIWKWHHGSRLSTEFVNPDSIPIAAGSSTHDTKQDFTLYTIIVVRGAGPDAEQWEIEKRYSQFVELNGKIKLLSGVSLVLPPKKMFGNKGKEFVAKRREGLQTYLQQLCSHPILQHALVLKQFLDFRRYCTNPWEEHFKNIGLFIRNSDRWELDDRLGRFGWRRSKTSALVQCASGPGAGAAHVLSWNPLLLRGDEAHMSNELLGRTLHYLSELVHPFVMPAAYGGFEDTEGGATIVIRQLCPFGSLRDKICNVKEGVATKDEWTKKYGGAGVGGGGSDGGGGGVGGGTSGGLPAKEVQMHGAEILEGLKFLHDKKIAWGVGHLHCGNILLRSGVAALSDLENGVASYIKMHPGPAYRMRSWTTGGMLRSFLLPHPVMLTTHAALMTSYFQLGLAGYYSTFISEVCHLTTLEAADVYCFGHVLFEMATGAGSSSHVNDAVPPVPGAKVISAILGSGPKKMPGITSLLKDPLFAGVAASASAAKPSFKASARVKEGLATAYASIEAAFNTKQLFLEKSRRQSNLESKRAKAKSSTSTKLTVRKGDGSDSPATTRARAEGGAARE